MSLPLKYPLYPLDAIELARLRRETKTRENKAKEKFDSKAISRSTAASVGRSSLPKTSFPNTTPPKSPYPALGRPSPPKTSLTMTSSQKPISSPALLRTAPHPKAQTVGKAAGSLATSDTFNIKRKPLAPAATISYGSPINRSAKVGRLNKTENSSPSAGQEEKLRAMSLTESKRLQLRSKSSKSHLVGKEAKSFRLLPAVSPALILARIKSPTSPPERARIWELFNGPSPPSAFLSEALARGSVIPKTVDEKSAVFANGSSPVHQPPPPPSPACLSPLIPSQPLAQQEESAFSDWEVIDWPWVTSYAPAPGLAVSFGPLKRSGGYHGSNYQGFDRQHRDGRRQNRGRQPKRKPWENNYLAGESPLPHLTAAPRRGIESPFHAGGVIFEDGCKSESKSIPSYQVPARRQGTEFSRSSKTVEHDPAFLSCGPSHPNPKNSATPIKPSLSPDAKNIQKEGSRKQLEKNLIEFAKAVSLMKKGDRQLIEDFLKALRNVGEEEAVCPETGLLKQPTKRESNSAQTHRTDITTNSTTQTKLNPAAPDFSVGSEQAKQKIKAPVQARPSVKVAMAAKPLERAHDPPVSVPIMPLQEKSTSNRTSKPLQENRPARQDSKSVLAVQKQLGGSENRRISKSDNTGNVFSNKIGFRTRLSSVGVQGLAQQLGEPIWIRNLVSTAKKLERVAKQQSIGLPDLESKPNANAVPFLPVLPLMSTILVPVVSQPNIDHLHDDSGPGREANTMDPCWAELRLKKFKEKYPLTGTRADDVVPMSFEEFKERYPLEGSAKPDVDIPVCKKLASDIQQKLEMILYHQKEKKALEKLTEELANNPRYSWL